MYSRGDVIEQLLDHAIVKMDASNKFLSLHRLVQAEYLYQASPTLRQEAFDAATTLLLEVFPHYNLGRIIDADRPRAELYIQHVLSLIFNFPKDRARPDALNPTLSFVNLVSDCSWFVLYLNHFHILKLICTLGIFTIALGQPRSEKFLTSALKPFKIAPIHQTI
jgi:hypothetical protein